MTVSLKLQSVHLLHAVVSSSKSSQIPLFRHSLVYETFNPLGKNNCTSKFLWRRTQAHNTLVCSHPKESNVAVASPALSKKCNFLSVTGKMILLKRTRCTSFILFSQSKLLPQFFLLSLFFKLKERCLH